MPGGGLSQKLSRKVGLGRAKELSLAGNFLGAEAARDWGLVNRVVAPDELLPGAQALARDIASADPAMVHGHNRLIDAGSALPFGEALALEQQRSQATNAPVRADGELGRAPGREQGGQSG